MSRTLSRLMHGAAFLQDLAVVMIAAGLVTVAFHALRQPVVLGYLLAGLLIGPHAVPFPLITDQESIRTLAELGVVFLLFALGLEFNFRKIRQLGLTAFIVAPLETGLMFFAGFEIGRAFGWSATDSAYLGCILMISSTTLIAKVLSDLGRTGERFAEVIFGILIAEDIIAVLVIASLSGVAMTGNLSAAEVLTSVGRLAVFLVAAVVLGLLVVPRLLQAVSRFKSDETLLVMVVAICFGMALLAIRLGYSAALGAFVTGALMAETEVIHKVDRLVRPLRDLFSAVFFVAIGLLIDPVLLWAYAWPVAVITITLIVGKVLACSFGSFVAGYDRATSLRVGLGLAQIGEFSFIIAALGAGLGVTSPFLYPIVVGVSAVTALITPYLIRHADGLVALHDRLMPRLLQSFQRDYTDWVTRLRAARPGHPLHQMVRRMVLQLGINGALIAAVFIAAAFVHRLDLAWVRGLPPWLGGSRTAIWLAALLLSLPLVVAFVRKLQAIAMLVSEMAVGRRANRFRQLTMRTLVANTILFTGIVALCLLILLLSSALLPTWEILAVLVLVTLVVAWLLHAFLVRIYARAQSAIRETLSRELPPAPRETDRPLPPLLEEAELLTVRIRAGSPALGRRLRDLDLRRVTGVSAVALRRDSRTLINPDPGLELREDDDILLLGDAAQLEGAERWLAGGEEDAETRRP